MLVKEITTSTTPTLVLPQLLEAVLVRTHLILVLVTPVTTTQKLETTASL
jgi:hypothetical protein